MAIVSRAILKSDWLNIAASDTTHDAMIDRLIDMVSEEIDGICNQPIAQKAVTRYMEGNNRQIMRLPYTTTVALTPVSTRSDPSEAWVVGSGYYVMPSIDGYSLYASNGFAARYYKIDLTAGYATVPQDVQLCAYEMVKELYYETPWAADAERFGVSAITETDAGVAFSKAILQMRPRVTQRLSRYIVYGV